MNLIGARAEVVTRKRWGHRGDRVPVLIVRETDTRFLVRVIATIGTGRWRPGHETWVRKGQTVILGRPAPAEAHAC